MPVFVHYIDDYGHILSTLEGEQENDITFTDVPHILGCNYKKKTLQDPWGTVFDLIIEIEICILIQFILNVIK